MIAAKKTALKGGRTPYKECVKGRAADLPKKKTVSQGAGTEMSVSMRRFLYATAAITGAAVLIIEILGAKILVSGLGPAVRRCRRGGCHGLPNCRDVIHGLGHVRRQDTIAIAGGAVADCERSPQGAQ